MFLKHALYRFHLELVAQSLQSPFNNVLQNSTQHLIHFIFPTERFILCTRALGKCSDWSRKAQIGVMKQINIKLIQLSLVSKALYTPTTCFSQIIQCYIVEK